MTEVQLYTSTLVLETCCHEGCGVKFGLDSEFRKRRRNDHKEFFCPNGHEQYFSGKSNEELLKQEVSDLKNTVDYLRKAKQNLHDEVLHLGYSLRAQKSAKTKIMNRVKNGVCPCCNRTFQDLQRHFKTKHPELLTK